jgi:hypothetical protein
MSTNPREIGKIALIVVVAVTVIASPAVAQQTNETVNNQFPTTDDSQSPAPEEPEECDPLPGAPQMQQVDLHTSESTINSGDPGRISGSIVSNAVSNCAIRAQVTMNVPNNMYIGGAGDVGSGTGGIVTSTFTADPGEAKDIAATVKSLDTGERTVVTDITYWPVGHKDMNREVDGLMLTFDVQEPSESLSGESDSSGSSGGNETDTGTGIPFGIKWGILAVLAVAVLGLVLVAGRKTDINIRK